MSAKIFLRYSQGAFQLNATFGISTPGVTALFGHSGAGQPTIWFSQIDEQDGSQVFFNYAIDPDNPARLTGFINVK